MAAALRAYGDAPTHEVPRCPQAIMQDAVRRLEAELVSPSIPVDQIRRYRRIAAAVVHPDLYQGENKIAAEALMKRVNELVAAALGAR